MSDQALAGVKVLDFSWVIAAPLGTKLLAEHGATVVRLESSSRLDILRGYILYSNGHGVNRCVYYGLYNNDKLGMTLNLKHPKARSVIERLVKWADLSCENYIPGTMERMGLGWDVLHKLNPGLSLIRASLFGQTGPYARQAGFGTMMQALAGYTNLVGWPDRPPVGCPSPYTDFIAPWYIVSVAMAALERRDQTGEGQCIDLSQMEAGLHFMEPVVLDASANGRFTPPDGNRHPSHAPHGVFRCAGDDRWCAILARDEAEWQGLCRAMGEPDWCKEQRFATPIGRKEHEDELERMLESWTADLPPEAVMARLQEQGVPAGLVENGRDNLADPQLNHRGYFARLQHPEMGETIAELPSFRLSETPAAARHAAPCLGQHTEFVCRELLSMSDEEFVSLVADGVFE